MDIRTTTSACTLLAALSFSFNSCTDGRNDNAFKIVSGEEIVLPDGTAARSGYLQLPDGKRISISLPDTTVQKSIEMIQMAAQADSDMARILEIPGYLLDGSSPWTVRANQPLFNCHTYALGEQAGLTASYSVEGLVEPGRALENGVELLLKQHFVQICSFPADLEGLLAITLAGPKFLMNDDRIFFVFETGIPEIGTGYMHSGRLVIRDGELFLRSKLGRTPLCEARLAAVLGLYAPECNQILVYRPKREES